MAPSRATGGLAQSSATSGIFFQDGHPQAVGNSQLSSSFHNSSNSVPGGAVLNSVATSGPSVGGSSMVTDANSGLSGGPNLQRSASFNTESYMRLPASPLSFSSNNISLSASSVMDGSCVVQQSSHQDLSSQQLPQNQHQQGASSATSLPSSRMGQGPRFGSPFSSDPSNISQLYKKPRLDVKQEDMQQQVLQQLLQRQDSMQLQHNPQFQALMQQQRLRQQQQQILQSIPPVQRAQLLHQQQLQLRQQLHQQGMQQPVSAMKRPYDNGVCSRRLMQYLYHQRQRPPDNSIAYWRKFVAEYYSPRAKKRWCLSLYDNVGNHSLGVFPQATTDAWHCDICGSKSGRGFEATFEVLPRLIEIKFGSGIIDELLFLDSPRECRSPTGLMMLEYGKAVQESVYEQLRVVREGQLRIIFTPDLKIFSWEFCARRHEELLPRRLVAPQVNQLLQVAQKCQNTISESGSDGVSQEDLQANNNMVVTAGRQLAKTLELNSLNDLGFAKRYVRCLQISEVVNSMKDLMTFCRDQKVGPIDGLKNYPRHAATNKLQMQEMEKLTNIQGLTDRNAINKMMGIHPGLNNTQMGGGNNLPIVGRGTLSGSAQAPSPLNNYQNMLMRQNSMNSNPNNSLHQEVSSPLNNSCNQSPSAAPQGPNNQLPGNMQNLPVGYPNSHRLQPQQQPQSPSLSNTSNSNIHQQNHHAKPPQGSQVLQQHMIQQLLQDMNNNSNGAGMQKCPFGGNSWDGSADNIPGPGPGPTTSGRPPSRSGSFRGPSNSDSSAGTGGNNKFNHQKAADLPPQNLHLSDDMVQDIANDFTENGFFNDDNLDFDWKA